MHELPVITSYYTLKTPYQIVIHNLIDSCERLKLPYSIEGIESFGSWELNCAYKPFFLLKKSHELKKPLLWIDADGVVMQKPDWISQFTKDLSVRLHDDLPADHPSKVISSTIFVNATEGARQLLRLWAKECQKQLLDPNREEEFWDQIALREALLSYPHGASFASLPLSYAKIFDHPGDNAVVDSPIIEHYQVSRKFKKLV